MAPSIKKRADDNQAPADRTSTVEDCASSSLCYVNSSANIYAFPLRIYDVYIHDKTRILMILVVRDALYVSTDAEYRSDPLLSVQALGHWTK